MSLSILLCWIISVGHGEKFSKYALLQGSNNWEISGALCRIQYGTELASLHSNDDYDEAKSIVDDAGTSAWIGLNDMDTEDTFIWSDGTPFDFGTSSSNSKGTYPWYPGQPDNCDQCNPDFEEDCVEISHNLDSKLNDGPCWNARYALCNIPSELCIDASLTNPEHSHWNLANWQNPIWSGNSILNCSMAIDGGQGRLIIEDKQWVNNDGILQIDYIFGILSGVDGVHGVITNYIDICNYYYLGIKVDSSGNYYLVIGRVFHSQDEELTLSSQLTLDTYVTLRVQIVNGVNFSVSIGDTATINYIEQDADIMNEYQLSATESGLIGIKHNELSTVSKSLYVSGTQQVLNPAPHPYQLQVACNSPRPSRAPTEFRSTTNPTQLPTDIPTRVPTSDPSMVPTSEPSTNPTELPSMEPSSSPLSSSPTQSPTNEPTFEPTRNPTLEPTSFIILTKSPSERPTFGLKISFKPTNSVENEGNVAETTENRELNGDIPVITKNNRTVWMIIGLSGGIVALCICAAIFCMRLKHKSTARKTDELNICQSDAYGHTTQTPNSTSNPSSAMSGELFQETDDPASKTKGSDEIELPQMNDKQNSIIIQSTDETLGGEVDGNVDTKEEFMIKVYPTPTLADQIAHESIRQKSSIAQGTDETIGAHLDLGHHDEIVMGNDVHTHGSTAFSDDEEEVIDENDFVPGGAPPFIE